MFSRAGCNSVATVQSDKKSPIRPRHPDTQDVMAADEEEGDARGEAQAEPNMTAAPMEGTRHGERQRSTDNDEEPENDESRQLREDQYMCQPCEPLKVAPGPRQPSQAEIELHRITHLPFQPWCLECVKGKATGTKHSRHGRHQAIARVGLDYFFLTGPEGTMCRRQDLVSLGYPEGQEGEDKLTEARKNGVVAKCLIIRCHKTGAIFAHTVPVKGPDEEGFATDLVLSAIRWLGHTKVLLKSDNEPALLKLVEKCLKLVRVEIEQMESASEEHSAPYDSKANGGTEIGVRSLKAQFRTLRLCLQKRVGRVIPLNHPIMGWLVEHTAFLLKACVRGPEGQTPWELARGRPYGMSLYGFGERVAYKFPEKGPQHDPEGDILGSSHDVQ